MDLKDRRETMGLTQKEMGSLMGLSQPNYSRIENGGRKPTIQQIKHVEKIEELYLAGRLKKFLK